ncbi:MAG TPA: DUF3806 domain-containing protein [Planctomycetaceae bacterium]|nr:DUF3806 domain-containing protein [Planctomycetaceae bacterium]HIQ20089.1 DUF3806 domain-containing protein [Planctomycetota bacterium]
MKQTIEPLTAAEEEWIRDQLDGVRIFVEAFSPEDAPEALTLGALDRAFAAWTATRETDPQQINAAIRVVGIGFGELLVRGLGLSWVVVTDDRGRELAVHGLPGRGDVLVFPQSLVAKRWQKRTTYFLASVFQQIAAHLAALQKRGTN